ncbi:DUF1735 domain-containing protein [Saccharicrinis sp. GN24d3]|uniref:DUF1735 domain-containing protein n=1 Tax=Saccharicrinis sp. GN24d3 TaxID=3458416 RepID=UPI0040368478
MKKLFIAVVGLMFMLTSCYDDYKFDYEYTSTYFSYQYPLRTLVVEDEEDLTFDIGVVLGGKRSNGTEEEVTYSIDASLLDEYPDLKLLPADRYSISGVEGKISIHSGEQVGRETVTLDKEWFLSQEDAVNKVYALPLRIVDQSTDSVTYDKDYSIIVVRYYNEFHGLYWLNGADETYDFLGENVESQFVYTNDDAVIQGYKQLMLTTNGENTIKAEYTGMNQIAPYAMNLTIRKDDGLVTITPDEESPITELIGSGYYDVLDRKMYLDYDYYDLDENDNVIKHSVKDTLIYIDTPLDLEMWQ